MIGKRSQATHLRVIRATSIAQTIADRPDHAHLHHL